MSDYGGWPTLAELRVELNVDPNSTLHDTTLGRALEAAIQETKNRTGAWDDLLDEPTPKLAQHALRMAQLLVETPQAAAASVSDPTLDRLISGHRRRFAIS
jgi:hypothetical protein